ncbi:ribonuclease D [Microbacterium sediminicola]|uniref:Ribonuclease D n=1 Tax=Microbacterium sediminicola TaxID=415210 RepID=A0ABN2HT44_9MICO
MAERTYTVHDSPAGLADATASLAAGTGPIAIDVERASGFRYSQRAYLVQIYRSGSGLILLDPPAIGTDFSALHNVLAQEEWIFHAASQDLPSLRELGMDPTTIFDTELASRLLGKDRVGLGAVVENTLGISLAKAHSAADWSTRPLPQEWLEYAAHDVEYLIDVRDVLASELEAAGKSTFAHQEFQAVLTREPKPAREEPWRRLSGLHAVRGKRGLAVARALWTAREQLAQSLDIAPGRLVPDRALVAAVMANPASKQQLAGTKEFTGRASRTELDRWWRAIEEGRHDEAPPAERGRSTDALPPPRAWADRNPEADLRLKTVRPKIESLAVSLSMPTENLLTPDFLRRVCWSPPTPAGPGQIADALAALGARPWQIAQTAQAIAQGFVDSTQAAETPPDPVS